MEPAYWTSLNLTLLTFVLASSLTGVSSAVALPSHPSPDGPSGSSQTPETPTSTVPSSSVVYCVPHPDSPAGSAGGTNANNNNGGRGRGGSSYEDKRMRGKTRGKFAQDDDHDDDLDHEGGTTYEREGKYWLVPPFLIGASSIVVAYVIIHCLYMHCSCSGSDQRDRVPQTVRRVQIATTGHPHHHHHHHGPPPTIVLSDPEDMAGSGGVRTPSSGGGMPRMVPLVSYDGGSYGQTQLVEAQPFLIYEPYDDLEPPRPSPGHLQPGQQQRRKSALLQLPQAIGRKLSQARLSFSSVGTPYREPRASICFVPVGRTLSDPSGATNLTFADGNQSHGVLFPTPVCEPSSACPHSCCKVCGVNVAASSSAVESTGTEAGDSTEGGMASSPPPPPLPVIVVDELETSPPTPSPLATDAVSNSNGCLGDADPDNN